MRNIVFKLVGRKTKTSIKSILYSFVSYSSDLLARVFATKEIAFLVTNIFGDRGRSFLGRVEYRRQFLKSGQNLLGNTKGVISTFFCSTEVELPLQRPPNL